MNIRKYRIMAFIAFVLLLAGCKIDLHTKAKEADANEMLGVLLSARLDAEKVTPDAGKTWTIRVEKDDTVRALEVLRLNALPHEQRPSMGDLFKKEGLISTPTEERVRFIYGIEQELSETVSKVDGVMVSRVHIVLPNNDPLAANVKPSSASVFVKHRREANVRDLVPAIKNLVVHAVEGLTYDQVTVSMVAASGSGDAMTIADQPAELIKTGTSWWVFAVLGLLIAIAAGLMAVIRFKPHWIPARLRRALGLVEAIKGAAGSTAA